MPSGEWYIHPNTSRGWTNFSECMKTPEAKQNLVHVSLIAFFFKNGNRRYKYLVLGHDETYFLKENSDSKNKYSEDDIIKILEFLVDNILVILAGKVFKHTVGIPWGTNCAPLLANIFLYSYKRNSYSFCSQILELFCGVVCVVTLPFWHFCWCRGFCHRTESDLFLFLSKKHEKKSKHLGSISFKGTSMMYCP